MVDSHYRLMADAFNYEALLNEALERARAAESRARMAEARAGELNGRVLILEHELRKKKYAFRKMREQEGGH